MIIIYYSKTEYNLMTVEEYMNLPRSEPNGDYIEVSLI